MTRNYSKPTVRTGTMNAHIKGAFNAEATALSTPVERSGYQRPRGADPVATVGALAVGLATVAALAWMNPVFVHKEKRTPTVVQMLSLPDDPPPAEQPPQPDAPPPKAEIMAPVPLVAVPQQPAMMQTASVIQPVPSPAPRPPAPPAAPAPRGPENLGELAAKVISAKPLKYPIDSRRLHEEGTVTLSVLLSTDGRVADISIAKSSGFFRLDRIALETVREWRWTPLVRDGNPVMVRGMVTIPFVLQRGGGRGGHDRGRDGMDDRDGRPGPHGREDRDGHDRDGRDRDRGEGRDAPLTT
jgi:protein TonB